LVEKSIVSYLRQRPSSQVVTAARQVLTHRWWSSARKDYELVISQYVLDEAAAGNPALAEERMAGPEGIPKLSMKLTAPTRPCDRSPLAQRRLWPRSRAAGYAEQGILILDLKHMTSRI
jgi:hypothetical protein